MGKKSKKTSPYTLLCKFKEEADELVALLDGLTDKEFNHLSSADNDFKQELGNEAIDAIIVAVGLIHSLGLDSESLLLEKSSKK